MKKIFLAFMAAACMLCGCSDDKSDEGSGKDSISISGEGVINAGPDGLKTEITVISSGDWRVSGVSDWLHVSASSGKNGDTVTVTVDPNDEEKDREAVLKFFTGASIATLKVISDIGSVMTLLSDPECNFDPAGHAFAVKVKTNVSDLSFAYSDGGEKWIGFDQRVDVFGYTTLNFTVSANETYENRTSIVTITGADAEPIEVTVNQKQTDVIIPEKSSYQFDLKGGELKMGLKSNIEYIVEIPSKYTWIHHQTAVDQSKTSRAMAESIETFKIDEAFGLRSGKINFKSKDGSYSITVSIVQVGDNHVYAMIPDTKFQSWLVDNDYAVVIEGSKCELTEAGQTATSFNCRDLGIVSFEGIDAFKNLTSLECRGNYIEKLPLGDLNIALIDLSIELGTTHDIKNIVISGSKLTELNMYNVYDLRTLDVVDCPALEVLNISYCTWLETLTIRKGHIFRELIDTRAGSHNENYTYKLIEKE